MRHPPPCTAWAEKLALRYEDLSPADRAALEAHITHCPACETAQADYFFLDASLRALPPPAVKPLPRLSLLFPSVDAREREATEVEGHPGFLPRLPATRQQAAGNRHFFTFIKDALLSVLVAALILSVFLFFATRVTNTSVQRPLGSALFTYERQSDNVAAVAWSPDGHYIASGSWDHTVQVWDARTKALLFSYQHNDIVTSLAWSPNGRYLASGSWDHKVQVWDVETQTLIFVYRGHSDFVDSLAWSPNSEWIASGSWDHSVQVWNALTGTLLFTAQYGEIVDAVAWSPDGKYIAVGGRDLNVHVLYAKTGKPVFDYTEYFGYPDYFKNSSVVNTLAWSPNSRWLATGYRDAVAQVWDVTTRMLVTSYNGHTNEVNTVAWSPDGRYVASGSSDHTVQVWNASTKSLLVTYKGHNDIVTSLSWSPDGRYIASGSWDHTVQVWQATYGG